MACRFCYSQHFQQNTGGMWSRKEIEETFKDMADIGVKAISLVSDGESTCNAEWKHAILYASALGMDTALGTNGLLYEPIDEVQSCMTYLRFNFSAASPSKYCFIHGVGENIYQAVIENIRHAVNLKRARGHKVDIGIQMVVYPENFGEILPVVYLAKGLGVDYVQLKHCSDDESGKLGINYASYDLVQGILQEAQNATDETFSVQVKWSKILAGSKRAYQRCLAPPLLLQLSGSGLVAPCGPLFGNKYFRYHIGSIHTTRFIEMFNSRKYWEIMAHLASDQFDAQTACGSLCLQDACNRYLSTLGKIPEKPKEKVRHENFV